MMNFKHTSQLAMLSVLLTFTHAIGQTAGAAGATPSDLVFQDEEFVLESQRVKRQQRLAKYQKQKQKEANDNTQDVTTKRAAKSITFKGVRSNNVAKQDRQKRTTPAQTTPAAEQANKQASENQVSTAVKPSTKQSSSRWNLLGFLRRSPQQSKQVSKKSDVNNVAKNTEQPAVRVINRIDINQYDEDSEKPVTLSTVLISQDAQSALHVGEKGATAALTGLSSVPVKGYDQVLVQAETERLVQQQTKNSRSWCIKQLKDSLTLNKEKIARTKAERNAKRRGTPRDSSQKKTSSTAKSEASQDSYKQTQKAGNSNIDAYVEASQYQCDSNATDWPCDECVIKRRANVGISICTMIVTVIAIIVGAIIISNASDSPDKGTAKP